MPSGGFRVFEGPTPAATSARIAIPAKTPRNGRLPDGGSQREWHHSPAEDGGTILTTAQSRVTGRCALAPKAKRINPLISGLGKSKSERGWHHMKRIFAMLASLAAAFLAAGASAKW